MRSVKASFFLLILGMAASLPARADFVVTPTFTGVDYEPASVNPYNFTYPSASMVGDGTGPIAYHSIVTVAHFDLTGINEPITGLSIAGTAGPLQNIYSGLQIQNYANAQIAVVSAGSYNSTDPVSVYKAVTYANMATPLGSFYVSNLIPPTTPFPPPTYGYSYQLDLVANGLKIPTNPTSLDLGFREISRFATDSNGIVTDLAGLQLIVNTVPEPAAFWPVAAGLAVIGFSRRRFGLNRLAPL